MNDIKQIIIRVPDEIHQKLKIKVLQDGISVQELLNNYIMNYLDGEDTEQNLKMSILEMTGELSMMEKLLDDAQQRLKEISASCNIYIHTIVDNESDTEMVKK